MEADFHFKFCNFRWNSRHCDDGCGCVGRPLRKSSRPLANGTEAYEPKTLHLAADSRNKRARSEWKLPWSTLELFFLNVDKVPFTFDLPPTHTAVEPFLR